MSPKNTKTEPETGSMATNAEKAGGASQDPGASAGQPLNADASAGSASGAQGLEQASAPTLPASDQAGQMGTAGTTHAPDDAAARSAMTKPSDSELAYGHLLCRARLRDVIGHPGADHDNGSRTVTLSAEFLERLRRAVHAT